jgi:hypothetical protein
LLSFGFYHHNAVRRQFDQKIRVVVGNIASRVDIVQLEMHCLIIFGERRYIAAIL